MTFLFATSTTTRLLLFHFCSSLSHGTSCRVHLLLKLLVTNLIPFAHHALITFARPDIAQSDVTHLTWSSTGWAHEWTDTREPLSWSGSRFFCCCESMTAPFHAFPLEHEACCLQHVQQTLNSSPTNATKTHGRARGMDSLFSWATVRLSACLLSVLRASVVEEVF